MKIFRSLALLSSSTLCLLASPGLIAADIVIGVPNWPSVAITAEILKKSIEDNFGLEVELQNGTNPVIFQAMNSGSMHIHPEVWVPNGNNLRDMYVDQKKTVVGSPNSVSATQGLCTTKQAQERTGLTHIEQLTDPEIAAHFDTNDDGLGEVWVGATGWASTSVELIRAKSYGYDQTFELQELDEGVALAALDISVKQQKNKLFFCYAPHHTFALYELVQLKEPEHNSATWQVLQPTEDPEWLAKSNAASAWPEATFSIHYAKTLTKTYPSVAAFLNNISLTADMITDMTHQVVVKKVPQSDYARQWIDNNQDLLDQWLESI